MAIKLPTFVCAMQFTICALAAPQPVIAQEEEAQKPVPPAVLKDVEFALRFHHPDGEPNWLDIDTSRGVPFFSLTLNGERVCGLIDTGAGRSVIDVDFASAVGIAAQETGYKAPTNGARVSVSKIENLEVDVPGQFHFAANLLAIDLPDYDCPQGGALSFILGLDVLAQSTLIYDPQRSQVQFLADHATDPDGQNFTTIGWREKLMEGTINGKQAKLSVDTGSTTMLLIPANRFDSFFAGERLTEFGEAINASGTQSSSVGVRGVEVSVEGRTLTGRAKRVSARKGSMDAKLGWPFFAKTYTIFDYRGNAILMRRSGEDTEEAIPGASDD